MLLTAFDLSLTASGFAIYRTGLDFGTIKPPKGMSDCPRLDYIAREVLELARGSDLCLIEDVAYSKNKAYAKEIAGLSWIVRLKLWKAEIPYLLLASSTIKKFATGSGKSEKNMMLLSIYRRWGIEAANDNEADAIGGIMIGRAFTGDLEPTMQPQREVLDALWRKTDASILERINQQALERINQQARPEARPA